MKFVHGSELSAAICNTLNGAKRDLAVAYFGKGARKRLGLNDARGVRIACDLWSGACNPHELDELIKAGATVKNSPGLHAKVYIGDSSVVVGSANASINGLGEEGAIMDLGVEAGVVLEEREEISKTRRWFAKVYRAASDIKPTELHALKSWWASRPLRRRAPRRLEWTSLLDRAIQAPETLPGIGFVLSNVANTTFAVKQARAKAAKSSPARTSEIRNWSKANIFTEWPQSDVRRWPGQFFSYHLGSRGRLYVRAMRLELRSENAEATFCKSDWRRITEPLGLSHTSGRDLEKSDLALAIRLMSEMDGGRVFASAEELSKAYRELERPADPA